MKKILLIDIDGKIPNLALMKLSTYHKAKGDSIKLIKLGLTYYNNIKKPKEIDATGFDNVYASVIFPINKDNFIINGCKDVSIGGTGYSLDKQLEEEINKCDLDYSIYPDNDISYGFITRGCIRNCYFCFVPKKEGKLVFNRDPKDIIKHKKVKFMDNNFLAYDKHKEILIYLNKQPIRYQFNQALDIRLIDDENAKLLSEAKYFGEYTFSFDDIRTVDIIEEKVKILKKYIYKDWKIKMFLYCNPKMKLCETIFRIDWCYKNKILPYLMRDKTCWDSEYSDFYVDLCAWVNQPNIFKKMSFEDFIERRHTNNDRIKRSLQLYKNTYKEL